MQYGLLKEFRRPNKTHGRIWSARGTSVDGCRAANLTQALPGAVNPDPHCLVCVPSALAVSKCGKLSLRAQKEKRGGGARRRHTPLAAAREVMASEAAPGTRGAPGHGKS
jgi:hypothetical protein